jgi:hypothetical protein
MDDALINHFEKTVDKLSALQIDIQAMIAKASKNEQPGDKEKTEPRMTKMIRPLTVLRKNDAAHKDAEANPDTTYITDRLNEIYK